MACGSVTKVKSLRLSMSKSGSSFICAICGHKSGYEIVEREGMPCYWCGSTWRARAMVLALLQALGKPNVALSQVNEDWSIRGIGISDDMKIASKLGGKFSYVNTYYHQGPKLDLCAIKSLTTMLFGTTILERDTLTQIQNFMAALGKLLPSDCGRFQD